MRNEFSNKYEEKKSKIKERLKLKLEYSEKIKNNENNKLLKKYNYIKNKEQAKIKILNYLNNNEEIDLPNINTNTNDNLTLHNKIKKGYNIHPKKEKEIIKKNYTTKNSHNMNLISFNENINNIYRKATINDFNNKEINNKVFYNMLQNLDNILEINSPDKTSEDISYKNSKKSPKYSENSKNSYKNDRILSNLSNQNNDNSNIEESNTPISMKNHGNRFNFLRANTTYNDVKKPKKYLTNKSSPKKVKSKYINENNLDILDTEQNIKNKFNNFKTKKIIYEEDFDYVNKEKIKKSFDLGNNNKDFNQEINKENNSEEESSDVTIVSLCSEDIKDISSDFLD